jgi:tetratricopeptide (TPR) repeat protein
MLEPGNYEYKKLIERFEEMVNLGEEYFFDVENFENISDYYVQFGKDKRALESLNIGLKQHPLSSELRIRRAQVYLDMMDLKKANADLSFVEKIDPHHPDVLIGRAEWLSKRGQHNKAIQKLKQAGEAMGTYDEVNPMIASEYLEVADYRRAAEYFKRVLMNDYDDGSALFSLSFCYDMLDDSEELVAFLKTYIDANPYSELAWHQLGLVYQKNKQYHNAIEAFDYACVIDDYFSAAHYEKARAYELLNDHEEAIKIYESLVEIEDFNAYAYLRMGIAYQSMGDYKQAKRFLTKAYRDDPDLDEVIVNMIALHEELEEWREALYYAKRLIDLHDTIPHRFYYALISQKAGLLDEASEMLIEMMDLSDCPPEAYMLYADILIEWNDVNECIDILFEASEIFPENPHVQLRLGALLFESDEVHESLYHFSEALSINREITMLFFDEFPNIANHKLISELLK